MHGIRPEDHSLTPIINEFFKEKYQLRSLKHYLLTKEVLPNLPEPFTTDPHRLLTVPLIFVTMSVRAQIAKISEDLSVCICLTLSNLQSQYRPTRTFSELLKYMCSRLEQGFQPSNSDLLLIGFRNLTLTPVLEMPVSMSSVFLPQFDLGRDQKNMFEDLNFSAKIFDQLYLLVQNATLEHLSEIGLFSSHCVEKLENLTLTTRSSVDTKEIIFLEIKYDSFSNPFCNSHARMLSSLFDGLDGITIEGSEIDSGQGRYSILKAVIIAKKNKPISSKTFEWGSVTVLDSFTECSKCFGDHDECTIKCTKCDHTGHIEGAGVCIVDKPPAYEHPPSTATQVPSPKSDIVSSSEETSSKDPVNEAGFISKFKGMLCDKFK